MSNVLVLNAAYQPISTTDCHDAIRLWFAQKAEILEVYEDKILHAGTSFVKKEIKWLYADWDEDSESWKHWMNAPCVIRLYEFVKPHKELKFYKTFTRKNIWERDKKKCAYCGDPISLAKVTYDHVIPSSRGGLTNWNNIVCSCFDCNAKKNNRTPQEAGMKLRVKPYAPIIAESYAAGCISKIKSIPKVLSNTKWRNYIYFNIPLTQDK